MDPKPGFSGGAQISSYPGGLANYQAYDREDIHKSYVGVNNQCTNIIVFNDNVELSKIKSFLELMLRLHKHHRDYSDIRDNRIEFKTFSTPIDRAHLYTLSLYFGKIDYLYYEMGFHIYGYERYIDGYLVNKIQDDSEKFFYKYAVELNLTDQIDEQLEYVKELMSLNDITDINDLDETDEYFVDSESDAKYTIFEYLESDVWFFDLDGLKEYIGG